MKTTKEQPLYTKEQLDIELLKQKTEHCYVAIVSLANDLKIFRKEVKEDLCVLKKELCDEIKAVIGEINDVRGETKDVRNEVKDLRGELRSNFKFVITSISAL